MMQFLAAFPGKHAETFNYSGKDVTLLAFVTSMYMRTTGALVPSFPFFLSFFRSFSFSFFFFFFFLQKRALIVLVC